MDYRDKYRDIPVSVRILNAGTHAITILMLESIEKCQKHDPQPQNRNRCVLPKTRPAICHTDGATAVDEVLGMPDLLLEEFETH